MTEVKYNIGGGKEIIAEYDKNGFMEITRECFEALIEKQIPKKPIRCYSGCVEMWKCPNCCKDIMRKQYQTLTDGRKDNFCQNCGQKLIWGE